MIRSAVRRYSLRSKLFVLHFLCAAAEQSGLFVGRERRCACALSALVVLACFRLVCRAYRFARFFVC